MKSQIKAFLHRRSWGGKVLDVWAELRAMRAALLPPGGSDRSAMTEPLNGQRLRMKAIKEIMDCFHPDAVIETGTFMGATTRFFANQGVPVYSIEIKRLFHLGARLSVGWRRNVNLMLGDSPKILQRLSQQGKFQRPMAYLDAHWWDSLPLQREIDQLLQGWSEVVMVIDDCAVPGDVGYGFDTYASVPLSLDTIDVPRDVLAAFPAAPSSEETGGKRGTLYLSKGDAATAALHGVAARGFLTIPSR